MFIPRTDHTGEENLVKEEMRHKEMFHLDLEDETLCIDKIKNSIRLTPRLNSSPWTSALEKGV